MTSFTVTPMPEIRVEQPAGTLLTDGASSVGFGPVAPGGNSARTFTIKNTGSPDLTGLGITIDSPDAADFAVTAAPTAPVSGPSGSTTFTVTYTPSAIGVRSAALHIASNDADEHPYDIALTGREPSANANLANLSLSAGTLTPAFAAATTSYTAGVSFSTSSLTVTPTAADANATVKVNGATVASGAASGAIALSVGSNPITIAVTAEDGVTVKSYTVEVVRPAFLAGTLDSAFNPAVAGFGIQATAVQPDGKLVVAGNFTSISGQTRNHIARLNADGSLESTATFNPGTGANGSLYCAVVQTDGRILLGGTFTTINGQTRNYLARLNADGTVESTGTFNPGTGANGFVRSMAVQVDGKILIAGEFTTVNGQTRNRIARLNADGTLESTATFNPGTGASGTVDSVAVQADGKILLGGFFTSVNGQARNNLARLEADGAVENTATFNPGTGANNEVWSVAVQPEGGILLGGYFTAVKIRSIHHHQWRLPPPTTRKSAP